MKKKKAMKAIAAAGVALGGASYFQDANVVYAAEGEQNSSNEVIVESREETTDAAKAEEKPAEEKPAEEKQSEEKQLEEKPADDTSDTSAPAGGSAAASTDNSAGAPAANTITSADDEEASADDVVTPADDGEASADDVITSAGDEEAPPTNDALPAEDSEGSSDATDGSEGSQEDSTSEGPWSEALSTSEVNSTDFSESYSDVKSTSEVNSASLSTETSNYTSTSESTSTVESTSQSKAESEYTSLSTASSEATSTYESASTSLDSTYTSEVQSTAASIGSMKDTALEDGKINDEEAKDLAQEIIKYDLASDGLKLNSITWDEDLQVYRVSYSDIEGVVQQKLYQYTLSEDSKDVTVNEAEVKYEADGDGTTTQVGGVSNSNPSYKPEGTPSKPAPEVVYKVNNDGTVYIKVDGVEYLDAERQINADGTYSYILDSGNGTKTLLNLNENGKVTSYTTYRENSGLYDGSGKGTDITVRGDGHKYDVAGGSPGVGERFQYIVVADEAGNWYKLTYTDRNGNVRPVTLKWTHSVLGYDHDYFIGHQTPDGGRNDIIDFPEGSYIGRDANGEYHVYSADGQKLHDLGISKDTSYWNKSQVTTYNYKEEVSTGKEVIDYNKVIADQSTVASTSESASAASESESEKKSEIDSTSKSNSIADSTSASAEQSNISSQSTSQSTSMEKANSVSMSTSTSASTSVSVKTFAFH